MKIPLVIEGPLAKHKKKIETIVLILILILLGSLLIGRLKDTNIESKMTVCYSCRHAEVRNINENRMEFYKCSRCASNIGIGWKCRDCHYEFAIIFKDPSPDVKDNEKPEYYLNFCKCPNCSSINTDPMLIKGKKK